MNSRGGSRAWRRLRDQVIREEPDCRIRGPKCTGRSTTADHIIPKSIRPDLTMVRANLRGACGPCNYGRGNRIAPPTEGARPTIHVVVGPPAAGKSTWVRQQAKPGDITIDYDNIANVLTPHDGQPHDHQPHVSAVTKAARKAAIQAAINLNVECNVYIIHSTPSRASINQYRRLGAHINVIDPGREVVMQRCKAERPWRMQKAAQDWYDLVQHYAKPVDQSKPGALQFFTN